MSKLVRSPAGEDIVVLTDDEFMTEFDVPYKDLQQWVKRYPLFLALWRHGTFEDRESGQATALWVTAARRVGYKSAPSATSAMLKSSGTVGACIKREINGKRTYSIKLVRLPEKYYKALIGAPGGTVKPAEPAAPSKPPEPTIASEREREAAAQRLKARRAERAEFYDQPDPEFTGGVITVDPPIEVPERTEEAADAVARHLLALVLEKAMAPPPEPVVLPNPDPTPDAVELGRRLAEQTEYGQRQREAARIAEQKLERVTTERDRLAHELTLTRTRMDQVLSRDQRLSLDEMLRTQLTTLMTQRPTTKGSDD